MCVCVKLLEKYSRNKLILIKHKPCNLCKEHNIQTASQTNIDCGNRIQETKNYIYNIPCECKKIQRPVTPESWNIKTTKMGEMYKSKRAEHFGDKDHITPWNKA